MMELVILLGATLATATLVALAARAVAIRLKQASDASVWPILLAILATLAVLQLAALLAVGIGWLYTRIGLDTAEVLGGQFGTAAFAASFGPIAAYVVTFLLVFRRVKGRGHGAR